MLNVFTVGFLASQYEGSFVYSVASKHSGLSVFEALLEPFLGNPVAVSAQLEIRWTSAPRCVLSCFEIVAGFCFFRYLNECRVFLVSAVRPSLRLHRAQGGSGTLGWGQVSLTLSSHLSSKESQPPHRFAEHWRFCT